MPDPLEPGFEHQHVCSRRHHVADELDVPVLERVVDVQACREGDACKREVHPQPEICDVDRHAFITVWNNAEVYQFDVNPVDAADETEIGSKAQRSNPAQRIRIENMPWSIFQKVVQCKGLPGTHTCTLSYKKYRHRRIQA